MVNLKVITLSVMLQNITISINQFPFLGGRVDHRIYNTPEEAVADLTKIVYDARESIVEVVDLNITESI